MKSSLKRLKLTKILCFGNPYLNDDKAAVTIGNALSVEFDVVLCENPEDIEPYLDKDFIILDVVKGIDKPRIIKIEELRNRKMTGLHDFDLSFYLQMLNETRQIEDAKIIGVPSEGSAENLIKIKELIEKFK